MADDRAEDILRRQGALESTRGNWETHWQQVADRVLPRQRIFQGQKRAGGEKLNEYVFDSTAPLALERFAAAMESMLTPRTQRWHELTVHDEKLADNPTVRQYLYDVTSMLFAARYSPRANFASQAHENYMSLGAFGTGALFVDDDLGRGIRYRAIALADLFIAENFQGVIDTVHRKFELTARQAIQQFGEDNLPDAITKQAKEQPDRKFDFIHAVQPNAEVGYGKRDHTGMAFSSCYVAVEGRKLVSEGGYRSFPYAVSRYVTAPRETYGRSPAMTVLPDIKTVNEQTKTILRAGQLAAEPPILLSNDGSLTGFKLRPGALNYGGLDANGQEAAKPFETGANMPITLEMVESGRKVINDAFLVTLFQILVEAPQMTATEAMLRAQEKGALLAPTMGRQQSEMLGPLIEREIDILAAAGALPPMPDELRQIGGAFKIEYASPLAKAQRADEGVAIMQLFQEITSLAQIDPTALHGIKVAETVQELAKISGVPAKLIRTPDELAQIQQQAAQAQQMQNVVAAAGPASIAAKNLAQAQALAGSAPSQVAPQVANAA